MKTKKYSIQFESVETYMSTELYISKEDYMKQLEFLESQITETKDNECPVEKLEVKVFDREDMLFTRTIYTSATGSVILRKYECKEGYHFVNKK